MDVARRYPLVLFDCDSTLTTIEGVDELAVRAGVGDETTRLTAAAMAGAVPLEQVYGLRLEAIRPDAEALAWLGRRYGQALVHGAAETFRILASRGHEIHIVSGGLRRPVVDLARQLGVPADHVHAVPVQLAADGSYAGFDDRAPTARTGGKAVVVKGLASGRKAIMVGDGVTDLEAGQAGARVVGFGGVVERPIVRSGADAWVAGPSLLGVLEVIAGWEDELP